MQKDVILDNLGEIRILHVDDDASQSEFLKYFLPESENFYITSITDPRKVMAMLEKSDYDCVVSDFKMPEINGIQLAEKIREKSDIPIILYTGQGSEEVAEAAFNVGVDDYMRKELDPSHYQVLAKRIKSVVEKKRSDKFYRTILEQTRDAILIYVDNKVVYTNKAMLNLLGLKDHSEMIENPFNYALEGDREKAKARLKEVMTSGHTPVYNKYRLRKKDGEIIYVDVSTSPISYKGKHGVIAFIRDITIQERLEEEKKESQERLRSLVELAPDGILTMDLKGVITSVNPAFAKITGYDERQIIGKNFLKLQTIRREDLKTYFSVFSSVLRGKMPPPFEFRYVTHDGDMGWGEAHIGSINVAGKKELIAILRDITERKRRALQHIEPVDHPAFFEEEQKLSDSLLLSMGQLAYLIGNEIIFPVRNVRFLCEELQRDPSKLRDYLPQLINSVDRALLFLEGFMSRTEKTILKPAEKNILDTVMDTIDQSSTPPTFKVVTKHQGEISANFDDWVVMEVFSKLIQKISILLDGKGKIDLDVSINDESLSMRISNISGSDLETTAQEIVNKLESDPDIILSGYDIMDAGGKLLFNDNMGDQSSIILNLPTKRIEEQLESLPGFKEIEKVSYKEQL